MNVVESKSLVLLGKVEQETAITVCGLTENRGNEAYSPPLSMDSSGRRDVARGTEELGPGLLKSDSLLGGHSYRGKDSEVKSNPWDAKDS